MATPGHPDTPGSADATGASDATGAAAAGGYEAPAGATRLIATFDDVEVARDARAALRAAGVDTTAIRIDDDRDAAVLGRLAQQREGQDAWLTLAPGDGRQARAAVHWSLWPALVGAVVGGLIGAVVDLGWMSTALQVVLLAVIGALALSTMGFVYGVSQATKDRPGPGPRLHRRSVLSVAAPDGADRLEAQLREHGAVGVTRSSEGEIGVLDDHRRHHRA